MRKLYRPLVLFFFGVSCLAIDSTAQSLSDDALKQSPLDIEANSLPSLTSLNHSKFLSDFNLLFNGGIGYLPMIDSSSLTSGFSKSYWLQSSAKIFGLPFNFSYSSYSSFSVIPQTFNYRQTHLSFDCEQFLENVKSEMVDQVSRKLENQKQKLLQFHASDSLKKYSELKDTFADPQYQLHINQLKDSLHLMMDSLDQGRAFDTTCLHSVQTQLSWYDKYQRSIESLMRFQEKFFEIQNQFTKDSLLAIQSIDKIRGITSKKELLQQAPDLGNELVKKLGALNFRQASIGTQLLENSPLTFHDYFSKGLSIIYNNANYILKAAVVKNNLGFTKSQSLSDSIILPENAKQNVFLLGLGKGDINGSYSIVTVSFIKNGQQTNLPNPTNKWLVSYLQKFSISKQFKFQYEVGKTMIAHPNESQQSGSISDFINKSAGITTLDYQFKKTKSELELESSYIGEGYFTGGNPLLQPGTVNVAAGLKQELFHSSLNISYKINLAHFVSVTNSGSRTWYQVAQFSYRLGKFGVMSCMISPYQFNYYLVQSNTSSISNANFIDLNIALNIPIGKQLFNGNVNLSNYAYQSSFSDTVFSSTTRHVTCYLNTSVHKRQIAFLGSYFIPDHKGAPETFINSMELIGTVVQRKTISLAVGPKWLGFKSNSDQAGGTVQLHTFFGKHFVLNAVLEKYFNIESDKPAYSSTALFTADLTFKL
ncbi:MAG TPA: hypothetical protein VE978_26185 [Chitinophagales bacterium]|nr:hypothetical protein [Chitinophagales bacterium]